MSEGTEGLSAFQYYERELEILRLFTPVPVGLTVRLPGEKLKFCRLHAEEDLKRRILESRGL